MRICFIFWILYNYLIFVNKQYSIFATIVVCKLKYLNMLLRFANYNRIFTFAIYNMIIFYILQNQIADFWLAFANCSGRPFSILNKYAKLTNLKFYLSLLPALHSGIFADFANCEFQIPIYANRLFNYAVSSNSQTFISLLYILYLSDLLNIDTICKFTVYHIK